MCVANWPWIFFVGLGEIFKLAHGSVPDEIVSSNGRPCNLQNAIVLPQKRQCLVPVRSAYNWTKAQTLCEMAKGSLYQLPSDIQVRQQNLLDCLFSMTGPRDMWINPVTELLPQFRWLNGSALYPIDFCPFDMPPFNTSAPPGVALTMDSCVVFCHNALAEYAFLSNTNTKSSCHCANHLEDKYKVPCDSSTFTLRNTTHNFISHTTNGTLLQITEENYVTSRELLCASLDNHTVTDQQFKTFPCFQRLPFICDVGTGTDCPTKFCGNANCVFTWQGACLRRVDQPLSWHEAYAFCNTSGGVLWHMHQLPVLTEFNQHILPEVPYWIGASNFVLKNQTNSASLKQFSANFLRVLCGEMFLSEPEERWQWSYTTCDHAKSFLCQYDLDATNSRRNDDQEVICPRTVGPTSKPINIPDPVPSLQPTVNDSDNFPVATLLSGIVAGLTFLICLTVCCTCCCCRRRKSTKDQKVAFVPYVMNHSRTALGSNTNVGSVSHGVVIHSVGSQTGDDSELGSGSRAGSHDLMSKRSFDEHQMIPEETTSMKYEKISSQDVLTTEPLGHETLEGKMDIQDEDAHQDLTLSDRPEVTLVTDNVDINSTVNSGTSRYGHARKYSESLDQAVEEIQAPVFEDG